MTNPLFEQALRDLTASHPHLSLSAAIALADNPHIPTPPYVTGYMEADQIMLLAQWAGGVSSIVQHTKNGKNIYAIKEIRQYTGCSLKTAKYAWEALTKMPVCLS